MDKLPYLNAKGNAWVFTIGYANIVSNKIGWNVWIKIGFNPEFGYLISDQDQKRYYKNPQLL